MKRCPICLGELLSAGDDCPRCGKMHYISNYSANAGAFIYDREKKKFLETNAKVYATEFFFAYDKGSFNAFTTGGAAAGGAIGAVVGGLADDAIHAIKNSAKRTSTATCYYWKDIDSLTYPAEPIQTNFLGIKGSRKIGGNGIEMRLKDGRWFTIGVPGFGKECGKELYQLMNILHQKNITQDSVKQEEKVISQTVNTGDTFAEQVKPAPLAGMVSESSMPKFFKCAYCGVTQMREGDFCVYCGKPAPETESSKQETPPVQPIEKSCSYCGAKVKSGMLFCAECGTKI